MILIDGSDPQCAVKYIGYVAQACGDRLLDQADYQASFTLVRSPWSAFDSRYNDFTPLFVAWGDHRLFRGPYTPLPLSDLPLWWAWTYALALALIGVGAICVYVRMVDVRDAEREIADGYEDFNGAEAAFLRYVAALNSHIAQIS
jgi:hypothetical protein